VVRILFFIGFIFLMPLVGIAQYSNSWINFNQQYYRIPVAKKGIYRLTYNDLQQAGFPVGSVDPRFIQLFHRGVEQAITVQGQADAQLNPGDYLEFYGQRNDGTLDAQLYQPSTLQPHPYYNLYSDTTSYFLTWTLPIPPGGKRMNSFFQNNVSGIPKETSQNDQELSLYTGEYSGGNTISNGEIQNTFFDEGEGWTDHYICTQNTGCTGYQDYIIGNLTGSVQSAGNPSIDVLIVGRDELSHQTQVYVGQNSGSLRLLGTQNFVNFETQLFTSALNWSDIGSDGNMTVEVRALGVNGVRDKISVSYVKVTIPRDFNAASATEKSFWLNVNANGLSYIEITNPASGARLWDITDPDNPGIIGTNTGSGLISAVVPNTNSSRILYTNNGIITPGLSPVTFQQINPASYNYLIVTHPSLLSGAQGYAAYRSSTVGGGYNTLLIDVNQIYNQFNYGEISPLGIFQFVKFMVLGGSPQYLFIIGKGRDVSAGYERSPSGLPDLVPSAGMPASDMAYSAGLLGSGYGPELPTGRISATTVAQVTAYLNKVQEMEAQPLNMLWRKDGLHLSGGIETSPINELEEFRGYLDGFKSIAEGDYWGGQITTIAKHDATAVQQINISDEVNAGMNLITFFGHSSPGTIDIDIGYVTDPTLGYNNPGKYPVFLINGCNAGNFFANGVSFGEDWMLAAGRGARGFIAHSSFGFNTTLQQYSDLFYRIGFADSTFIKKGLGDVQKEVARQYALNYGTDMPDLTQIQQMVLLGDPAVKLFGSATPDYATDDSSISLGSYDGNPITALTDSFAVHVIVKNLGAARSGPLSVSLTRTFSDNSSVTYDSVFNAPLYQDTLVFKVFKGRANGYGNNIFKVVLDYTNQIVELNESNNTATLNKSLPLGGTKNLIPYPYAIVNQQQLTLILQCTDILSGSRGFQVDVDTVNTFNSPFFQHQVVQGNVLAKLAINLLSQDSLVYYWRTKLDQPKPDESTDWVVSSFTYIANSPEGWVQKEFGQLNENDLSGLVLDTPSKSLKFIETESSLYVKTFGASNPALNTDVSVKIDNAEYNLATQGQPCRSNTINIIAFNKTSLVPYAGLPFNFQDPRTCGREPQVINSFLLSEMETGLGDDVPAMIDSIHTSDSVLVFSIGDAGYTNWSSTLLSSLHGLGILESQLSALQNGDPVVILGRKGATPGTAKIFTATSTPANQQELQVAEDITGRYTSGTMNSVVIGPAAKWKEFIPQASMIQGSDVYSFSYYGTTLDGTQTLLKSNVTGVTDLSTVDPTQYPYLKLVLNSSDEINLSPVQLAKWIVIYDPLPEGVLLFPGAATQQQVTEGQSWSSFYKFVNISDKVFSDSLTVNLEIVNNTKRTKEISNFKIEAPLPGDTTTFQITTNTTGKAGLNDVDIYVNPKILPEQYYDNNSVDLDNYLRVLGDTIGPVLDVTIDGRYVVNGDFVSPNPFILMVVEDNNPYLLKTDTTGITILMTFPCTSTDCPPQPIYFSRNDVVWHPATASTPFRVEFRPKNLPAGAYLLFVQAADQSGNKSGAEPYQVTFEVKDETSFVLQSVYPNPSASVFYFNFVITGNVLPDDFDLQIYGMDGKKLQEFTMADIGNFHIGTNQLIWDPRDVGGGGLSSGLYIYRLLLQINNTDYHQSGKVILRR
jgi:Peptidase family C25